VEGEQNARGMGSCSKGTAGQGGGESGGGDRKRDGSSMRQDEGQELWTFSNGANGESRRGP